MKKTLFFALAALVLTACNKQQTTTVTEQQERVEQVRTTVLEAREIQREISLSTNLQGYLTQNEHHRSQER